MLGGLPGSGLSKDKRDASQRFRAVTLLTFEFRRANHMNAFGFMQATISHDLKNPHPKALQSDRLSPRIPITTQSQRGEGISTGEIVEGQGFLG